jgi:hypothetical protein
LQRRYIVEGDDLAHDAETRIGELMAALRKITDMHADEYYLEDARAVAQDAIDKCANGD